MTDFRARGTIMGPAGLTAVFGMGTGVAPPVWSPEIRPAGGQARRPRYPAVVGHDESTIRAHARRWSWARPPRTAVADRSRLVVGGRAGRPIGPRRFAGGGRSGWSSCSAVRTGRLRRSPAVHARPIDLVVFQEPSQTIAAGNLVLEGASRLDAFSAYPVPTWLPGDAPSGTAGTPEVGPPQSSRTRGDSPQVSYAHGR